MRHLQPYLPHPDAVLALMEVASLYTAFVIVAKYLDPVLILDRSGFARLAIPPVIILATISLADAYGDPQEALAS